MNWFFIALGAPFLWALTNISDQYLVEKYSKGVRGSGGLVLFSSLIGLVVAIGIYIFVPGVFSISLSDKLLLSLIGVITILWVILYLFTLEIEEVSSVVPWFLTIPIFGYAFGYLFLGETLSSRQIIGSLIILLGVLIVSIDFSGNKSKLKWLPVFYMLICCFLISWVGIIFKYITIEGDFWVSSFWEYIGLGGSGLVLYVLVPKYRQEFNLMNKKGGLRIFTLNTFSEIFNVVGNLITRYATLLAPITMVYLVGSFQPAIVLFLTLFTTKFFPQIATENVSKKVLIPKILAITIVILGSFLIYH